MTAIFREDLSQEDYQKVYRHLLTILSRGVKNNQWVCSNKGEYSGAPRALPQRPKPYSAGHTEISSAAYEDHTR